MSLVLLSASHHDIDLADVERLSVGAPSLGPVLAADDAVRGAMVLATCNRLEIYLDTAPGSAPRAIAAARAALAALSRVPRRDVDRLTRALQDDEALHHLFDVASGLDSMVVGEREITGQVRRAIETSRRDGTSSTLLEIAVQRASRASRRVAVETDLARSGRSVVSVALDLAGQLLQRPGCPRDTATWASAAPSPCRPSTGPARAPSWWAPGPTPAPRSPPCAPATARTWRCGRAPGAPSSSR